MTRIPKQPLGSHSFRRGWGDTVKGGAGLIVLVLFAFARDRWSWITEAENYLRGLVEASIYTVIVLFFILWFGRRLTQRWSVVALVACGVLWFWLLPSDNYLRDGLVITVGVVTGLVIGERLFGVDPQFVKNRSSFVARFKRRSIFLGILSAWALLSATDLVWPKRIPSNRERFLGLKSSPEFEGVRVGLCLSGGGYRAALFHAGVVAQMEKFEVPIHCISSVSGGSIFAAFYDSGGSPETFLESVVERRFNLKRQLVLLHNLIRLPAPLQMPLSETRLLGSLDFNRRDLQEEMLDRLFLNHRRLGEDLVANGQPPQWVICTTDLNHGWQVGFTKNNLIVLGLQVAEAGSLYGEQGPDDISISRAVSLSGGFPGAFPAWPARVKIAGTQGVFANPRDVLLADGGIIDNLGIKLLRALKREAQNRSATFSQSWNVDLILVSNGGQMLGGQHKAGNLSDVGRAIELSSSVEASRNEEKERHYSFRRDSEGICFFSPGLLADPADFALTNMSTDDEEGHRQVSSGIQDLLIMPYSMRANFGPGDETCVSDAVLSSLCEIFPDHTKASTLLQRFRATPVPKDLKFPPMGEPRLPFEDLMKFFHPKGYLADQILEMLMSDFNQCLAAFQRTSTLVDCVPVDDAKRIYRLGRYLVVLNKAKMLRQVRSIKEQSKQAGQGLPPATTSTTTGK